MNRKATFAKRQRETDLKDKARQKAERKAQRQNTPRTTKGPQIAWDEQAQATDSDTPVVDPANQPSLVPRDDTP
jgi:hypothetical protein